MIGWGGGGGGGGFLQKRCFPYSSMFPRSPKKIKRYNSACPHPQFFPPLDLLLLLSLPIFERREHLQKKVLNVNDVFYGRACVPCMYFNQIQISAIIKDCFKSFDSFL